MRSAIDNRAKREVEASEVGPLARHRAYSCPVCGAGVFYKRRIGQSPNPGFAHFMGSPDCELYQPGIGDYVAPSATTRVIQNAEDAPEEIGMCLEDQASWTTYLRLPEIVDQYDVRLRSLRNGSIEVDAGGVHLSVSLLELRPGIGSARLVVPPTVKQYNVTPRGSWPSSISQKPWRTAARGLNPRGTVFTMRRGEWVRLKEGSAVELGDELRVVAQSQSSPPSSCSPEATGVVFHNRLTWQMWRVSLPDECDPSLERWAEGVGVVLLEPAWDLTVLSVPHGFSSKSRVPVFGTNEMLIAKLTSPQGRARTSLSLKTGTSGQGITVEASSGSTAFVAFDVPWPGSNEFKISDQPTGWFETAIGPSVTELREALRAVPSFCLLIGENVMTAWRDQVEIPALGKSESPPEIVISPELEDLRLGLSWEDEEGGGSEQSLTCEATKNRVREFWGRDVKVKISAGALGCVRLWFRSAQKVTSGRSNTRTLSWAGLALREESRGASAWTLRRAAAGDKKLLRATQSRGNSRWMPLVVRELKESKV